MTAEFQTKSVFVTINLIDLFIHSFIHSKICFFAVIAMACAAPQYYLSSGLPYNGLFRSFASFAPNVNVAASVAPIARVASYAPYASYSPFVSAAPISPVASVARFAAPISSVASVAQFASPISPLGPVTRLASFDPSYAGVVPELYDSPLSYAEIEEAKKYVHLMYIFLLFLSFSMNFLN